VIYIGYFKSVSPWIGLTWICSTVLFIKQKVSQYFFQTHKQYFVFLKHVLVLSISNKLQ